jgi:hypothetical protein
VVAGERTAGDELALAALASARSVGGQAPVESCMVVGVRALVVSGGRRHDVCGAGALVAGGE